MISDTIAMIPARIGSERLKYKNLALLDGKPLISYAINAAIGSGLFDRVVVNADHEVFGDIASRHGVEFYLRPAHLATSQAVSDDVVIDFMTNNPCDTLCWVNTIAPLQTADHIKGAIQYFKDERLDSMITVTDCQVHATSQGAPVNFHYQQSLAKTQDLSPCRIFNYALMAWDTKTFIYKYNRVGYAMFAGKFGVYPYDKRASMIVKTASDLRLIEGILRAGQDDRPIEYDVLIDSRVDK